MSAYAPIIKLATLTATQGFAIETSEFYAHLGASVSWAGDINGDGRDDLILGAPGASPGGSFHPGSAYILFGTDVPFGPSFDVSVLNGSNGLTLNGFSDRDNLGSAVSDGGDVNGDGYADFIVGAPNAQPFGLAGAGAAYVVFGRANFASTMNSAMLDGSNGFQILGSNSDGKAGSAVSSAGDVNHDGFDDLLVGVPYYSGNTGFGAVIFGKAGGFDAQLSVSALDGMNGFLLTGSPPAGYAGFSLAGVGDTNGDGIDDFVVSAPSADNTQPGSSYVVFGRSTGFGQSLNLANLNGTTGYRIDGATAGDFSGGSVSGAGDVNGDGLADLIIGADAPNGSRGSAAIVFGHRDTDSALVNVTSLDGTNGFRLLGSDNGDLAGASVANAGDVNGDGFDDLLIGAPKHGQTNSKSGAAYVVFGAAGGFPSTINLGALNGNNGFLIGNDVPGAVGISVSKAGDVNHDGLADILIGASGDNRRNFSEAGTAYVIYGSLPTTSVTRIGSEIAQAIQGAAVTIASKAWTATTRSRAMTATIPRWAARRTTACSAATATTTSPVAARTIGLKAATARIRSAADRGGTRSSAARARTWRPAAPGTMSIISIRPGIAWWRMPATGPIPCSPASAIRSPPAPRSNASASRIPHRPAASPSPATRRAS